MRHSTIEPSHIRRRGAQASRCPCLPGIVRCLTPSPLPYHVPDPRSLGPAAFGGLGTYLPGFCVSSQRAARANSFRQNNSNIRQENNSRRCMLTGSDLQEEGRRVGLTSNEFSDLGGMGMEVCCMLSMIEKQQAEKLKKAGLTAYNHNLDTSREYYANLITTRSYDDILQTLKHAHEAGISISSADSTKSLIFLRKKHLRLSVESNCYYWE